MMDTHALSVFNQQSDSTLRMPPGPTGPPFRFGGSPALTSDPIIAHGTHPLAHRAGILHIGILTFIIRLHEIGTSPIRNFLHMPPFRHPMEAAV
jgi:hypothetical protein